VSEVFRDGKKCEQHWPSAVEERDAMGLSRLFLLVQVVWRAESINLSLREQEVAGGPKVRD
jgi:hypothetical protein